MKILHFTFLKFNAITFVEVGETKLTIAEALERVKKSDNFLINLLENNIKSMLNKKDELTEIQENEVKELEKTLYGSTKSLGSTAISEKLSERREAYNPIIEEAFGLKEELAKEKDLHENFMERINTQINIANVKHTLDIELD